MKKIYIHKNQNEVSVFTARAICERLRAEGFTVTETFEDDADFMISVGGDGTFLSALKASGYSDIPAVGVNTGHLGFFTELSTDETEKLVNLCRSGDFKVQRYRTIKTVVETSEGKQELSPALNDVLIKHNKSSLIHLDLYIGSSFIEKFSGDGVLIASSAGSTAYNYSLGGSIVDPDLALLQLTPVAPVNNAAYRSFTSSLLLPASRETIIKPSEDDDVNITIDGRVFLFEKVRSITVSLSDKEVSIVRLPGYDFWGKVKSKFL